MIDPHSKNQNVMASLGFTNLTSAPQAIMPNLN
jgi:hypothetical protein